MSTENHTPGPWLNMGPTGYGRLIVAAAPDGARNPQIAVVYGPGVTPEAEANARLISYAPHLVDALDALVKRRTPDAVAQARAVLMLVRGWKPRTSNG